MSSGDDADHQPLLWQVHGQTWERAGKAPMRPDWLSESVRTPLLRLLLDHFEAHEIPGHWPDWSRWNGKFTRESARGWAHLLEGTSVWLQTGLGIWTPKKSNVESTQFASLPPISDTSVRVELNGKQYEWVYECLIPDGKIEQVQGNGTKLHSFPMIAVWHVFLLDEQGFRKITASDKSASQVVLFAIESKEQRLIVRQRLQGIDGQHEEHLSKVYKAIVRAFCFVTDCDGFAADPKTYEIDFKFEQGKLETPLVQMGAND
ncbi:hypothetical protein OIO90_002375 [Microbotryomycetes sp. JL221]|nr:hypothetical protein OIO90_002375 [Microbotryomycetes sp. JL221]